MHALYDALRLLFISAPAVAAGKRCTACTRQLVRTVSLRALRAVASDVQAADQTKSAIKTIHAIFMLSSLLQETMTDAYVRHMKTPQGSAIRSSSATRGISRPRSRLRHSSPQDVSSVCCNGGSALVFHGIDDRTDDRGDDRAGSAAANLSTCGVAEVEVQQTINGEKSEPASWPCRMP
jgi:hypothetical protein